ncbi:MAG: hypothetical protein V1866_05980 [archaeon]
MRKGQAALEFLTTYGWAMLVILVMIGALVYFGVLSPSKTLPPKCIVEIGFDCKEYQVTTTSFNISVINKKGEGLKDVNVVEAKSDAASSLTNCLPSGIQVGADEGFYISCTGDFSASQGDKVNIDFTLNYTMARGTYSQKFSGNIYAPVQ